MLSFIIKILDVAHNRESIKALVNNLKMIPCYGKTHIILGMLKDKDHRLVIRELKEVASSWHFVSISHNRGIEAKILSSELRILGEEENIFEYTSVKEAIDKIRKVSMPDDRIVITGSFYTVGAAIKYLNSLFFNN